MITQQYIQAGDFKGWVKVYCEPNIWGDCHILYLESPQFVAQEFRKALPLSTSHDDLVKEAKALLSKYTVALLK